MPLRVTRRSDVRRRQPRLEEARELSLRTYKDSSTRVRAAGRGSRLHQSTTTRRRRRATTATRSWPTLDRDLAAWGGHSKPPGAGARAACPVVN